MQEVLAEPANASSVHAYGRRAKKYLEDARKILADAVSAWPNEILFTASGTEANITALRGFPGRRLLVSAVEHSSIIKSSPFGRGQGESGAANSVPNKPHRSHRVPLPGGEGVIRVDSNGILDLAALEALLMAHASPALVSVMLANNETGVIQPVSDIAMLCKKHSALLHCDAVQGFGKIPVDFGALGADMLSVSAHKCGGPVGAAALVVRRDLPFIPLLTGGGQELGRRAGTENVAAIAGFAAAVEAFDFSQMQKLRGWLEEMEKMIASPRREEAGRGAVDALAEKNCPRPRVKPGAGSNPPPAGDGIVLVSSVPRLPNTSCIVMPGVSNEVQLMDFDLKGFAVSAGSACSSGRVEVSHVLLAMGIPKETAACAIRVSAGWNTTEKDITAFTEAWKQTHARLCKKAG